MSVTITGASDDLIEVDGDLSEEFSAPSSMAWIAVSTGDLIRLRFEEEGWRATLVKSVRDEVTIVRGDGPDSDDVVTVVGPVEWVLVLDGDRQGPVMA